MEPTANGEAREGRGEGATKPSQGGASAAPVENLPYAERYAERDTDRTVFVGVMVGIMMFFVFQGFILAAFQTPVISGETPLLAPLRFTGLTQLVYAAPTLLFFINRKCPLMAKGLSIVTGVIFVGGIFAIALG